MAVRGKMIEEDGGGEKGRRKRQRQGDRTEDEEAQKAEEGGLGRVERGRKGRGGSPSVEYYVAGGSGWWSNREKRETERQGERERCHSECGGRDEGGEMRVISSKERNEGTPRVGEGDKMLARLQDKEPEPPNELVVVHKRYQPHLHIPGTEGKKDRGGVGRPEAEEGKGSARANTSKVSRP